MGVRDLLQARVAAPHELAHGALDRGLSRAAHGFSDVAMEIPKIYFENELDRIKEEKNVKMDTELTAEDLKIYSCLLTT